MFAICGLFSGRCNIGNITACAWFRDSNTGSFSTREEVWEEFLVEGSISELDDGRNACEMVRCLSC